MDVGVDVSFGVFVIGSPLKMGDFTLTGDVDEVAEIGRFNATVVVACFGVVGCTYTILSDSNRNFVCILAGCVTANSSFSTCISFCRDFNCCCLALNAAACGVPGLRTS